MYFLGIDLGTSSVKVLATNSNNEIVGDVTKSELLKIRPTLYNGNHIRHPKIRERKTRNITIESDEQLLVEVDGDVLGESPASFWILPSALTIVV